MNPMQRKLQRRTNILLAAFDSLAEMADRSDEYTQENIDKIAVAVLDKSRETFEKLRRGNVEPPFKLDV